MRFIVTASLVVVTALTPLADALAQTRSTFVPSISVSTVHDDNLFTVATPTGDYLTQLRPSLEANYESPTIDLQSLVSFDIQMSARHSALNTLDARRHAMFDGRVRSSQATMFGLAARYDKTETPGELNLDSAINLGRQRAQRWQLTPSISYRATPRTTITSQYDWTNETLAHQFEGNLHVARAGVAHQSSARTTWSAHYLGRLFVDGDNQHRSQSALFGWNREMAPGANLMIQAGPRFTSYNGVAAEILAAFIRRTPRSRFLVDYWHGETIILGIIGPVKIQSGSTKVNWTVRRNVEFGLHAGVFDSTTLGNAEARVYHTSAIGAWSPRDSYILQVSYGVDFQKGDIRSSLLADERVRRGVFLVRLTIAPRFSRLGRPQEDPSRPSTPLKGVIQ